MNSFTCGCPTLPVTSQPPSVLPCPQHRMLQNTGWGWRPLLKVMAVVPRGQPTCPRQFWVFQASVQAS